MSLDALSEHMITSMKYLGEKNIRHFINTKVKYVPLDDAMRERHMTPLSNKPTSNTTEERKKQQQPIRPQCPSTRLSSKLNTSTKPGDGPPEKGKELGLHTIAILCIYTQALQSLSFRVTHYLRKFRGTECINKSLCGRLTPVIHILNHIILSI